jgi:hypothetical protein
LVESGAVSATHQKVSHRKALRIFGLSDNRKTSVSRFVITKYHSNTGTDTGTD